KNEQGFLQEILIQQQQGKEAIISQLRQQNSQLEQQNKSFKDIQKQLENELQVLKNQRGQMEATLFESNQTNNLLKQEIEKLKQTQKMLENDLKAQSNSKQNIQSQNQYQSTNSQQQIKKKEEEALKKQMQEEQEKQIQLQKASNKAQTQPKSIPVLRRHNFFIFSLIRQHKKADRQRQYVCSDTRDSIVSNTQFMTHRAHLQKELLE
ncbi:hypothetical protein ABPG74_006727, partial [Tetrahymena malaccensis]